jgi:hypothetical protein
MACAVYAAWKVVRESGMVESKKRKLEEVFHDLFSTPPVNHRSFFSRFPLRRMTRQELKLRIQRKRSSNGETIIHKINL